MTPLLDTNVILRHVLQDHATFSPLGTAILRRIASSELEVHLSDLVVFETVFSLHRSYRIPRGQIASFMLGFLDQPGVRLAGKSSYHRVFELFTTTSLDFGDCYNAALMERLGITEVLSFDTDFDRLPGVVRRDA